MIAECAGPGQTAAGHLDDAVQTMRHPLVILDADERLVAFNRAYAALHLGPDGACVLRPGMSFGEVAEWRRVTGFYASSTGEGSFDSRDLSLRGTSKGEARYRLRDGRWMFVDRYRLPSGFNLGIWIDITAMKQAEQQLRESAARLGRSQDHLARAQRIAATGSVEWDLRAERVEWSDETYRIFGLDRHAVLPVRGVLLALVHADDRARVAESVAASTAGRVVAPLQYRILRPDGTERVIMSETALILDDVGTPTRVVGTIQDVTEAHAAQTRQKKLEAELRIAKEQAEAAANAVQAANAQLERRVEERTAQLQQAQDELLKKERLSIIGQLTATVAHELRNPLSSIRNTVYSLRQAEAAKGADVERSLGRIERSIERCTRIIGELLDYSRLRELRCEPRSFDDWLREVIAEQATPQSIAIVWDLHAGTALVQLDPDRLRQVVINLFENAVQAMTGAGAAVAAPAITLRTGVQGRDLEFALEDNGPGMSPETLARVFEPLFSTKASGTGLGLPAVKQIVEQHGGEIALTSAPGAGTRAVMRLSLAQDAAAA